MSHALVIYYVVKLNIVNRKLGTAKNMLHGNNFIPPLKIINN